jgi:DNA-binding NarL/FixJ family response regulator
VAGSLVNPPNWGSWRPHSYSTLRRMGERFDSNTRRNLGSSRLGVVLVDPAEVVREGLGLLIESQPDLEVLAQAASADTALQALRSTRRSSIVVLVALELDGDRDAFWLINELRRTHPSARVLATGNASDRMAISRALFVGADGYLGKRSNPIQFLDRRTVGGDMVLVGIPKDWLGPIAGAIEHLEENAFLLTSREREVISLAASGLTARQIAERLGVAERTVNTHLGRIYTKLGVNNRVSAVTAAAQAGLVTMASLEMKGVG